jgi:hypothetical protein
MSPATATATTTPITMKAVLPFDFLTLVGAGSVINKRRTIYYKRLPEKAYRKGRKVVRMNCMGYVF